MSKKSVFRFTLDKNKKEIAKKIIDHYLESNNFVYQEDKCCYLTITEGSGNYHIPNYRLKERANIDYLANCGFEYKIENNFLIIKAFIYYLNPAITFIKSNATNYIHSKTNPSPAGNDYYINIQNELFDELNKNGIELQDELIENIHDGFAIKLTLFIIGIVIAFILLLVGLMLLLSS